MSQVQVTSDLAPAGEIAEEELLAPFAARIEPVRVTPLYRLGMLLVTIVMVLLPLLYLGLIAVIGYGVWYHATENTQILNSAHGRNGRAAIVMYLGPIVVGGVGIVFMIKPLFAPRGQRSKSFTLEMSDQPLLFRFVERLCHTVRAPMPRRIALDSQVNASASFRRGVWSLMGQDLVLTIGLPLVAGLSLRQFAGVLAHEFGHFAQGSGMRLTFVVRSVNAWFARVVYERDAWDEQLVSWADQMRGGSWVVLAAARGMVWLTRRVLWALMWVGHVSSCFMLRQMEYDADRYEARIAGSETFARTVDRLFVLALANQGAHVDLRRSWQAGRLADDLPRLILANVDQMKSHAEAIDEARSEAMARKTGLLDTHPADRDRIASAERERAAGLFTVEAPATVLFRDFDSLSRKVTREYYCEMIGETVGDEQLAPSDELVRNYESLVEGSKALARGFQGRWRDDMVFVFTEPGEAVAADGSTGTEALGDARARLLEEAGRAPLDEYRSAQERLRGAEAVQTLVSAGLRVDAARRLAGAATGGSVSEETTAASAAVDDARRGIGPLAHAARRRLECALAAHGDPAVADALAREARDVERGRSLAHVLDALRNAREPIAQLDRLWRQLALLLEHLGGQEKNATYTGEILRAAAAVRQGLSEVRDALGDTRYPFEHAGGGTSIGLHLVPSVPAAEDVGGNFGGAQAALEKNGSLSYRVVASLVVLAEQIEAAAGLPPLPDPPGDSQR
jgi:Zn-dependent protease with chaperone function